MVTIMVKTKYRLGKFDFFVSFWSNIANTTVLKIVLFTYNVFFQVENLPRNISISNL